MCSLLMCKVEENFHTAQINRVYEKITVKYIDHGQLQVNQSTNNEIAMDQKESQQSK